MTSMALSAWQAWLLIGLAGAIAAGLFLMKLRPPRTVVPSLILWRRVLDESRNLTLWERIRRAVSLVATVLVAVLLALAAAGPTRLAGNAEASSGRLLIVMDTSWSMRARTGNGETRWERAVAEARRLIASAAGGEVALGTTAGSLAEGPTPDGALVESALDRLEPLGGDATAWPRVSGTTAVHFITDGATARPLDSHVVVHSVFEPAPNVAITAFEIRPSLDSGPAGDAYLEIANYAPAGQKVRVSLLRGAARIFEDAVDVGASAVIRQVVPIARGGHPELRARIDAAENALDVDDEAVAWVERAAPLEVTVVSAEPDWLRRAFEQDPDVRATFVRPETYLARGAVVPGNAAVLIFDGWAPEDPPRRPSLLFAPPVTTPWLSGLPDTAGPRRLADERRPRWEAPGNHRVVRGVDPFTLAIERARAYGSQQLTPVARSARGTPLVYASESAEHRLVLVTFGPTESNLASAPGFPVLIANALEWLARPEGGARKPGLAVFDSRIVSVAAPDGSRVPLVHAGSRTLAALQRTGLYSVEGGGARSMLAVNAGDPHLSNLSRTTPTASAGTAVSVGAGGSARPWWVYCAWAAFLLVVAEWWTWQRRITV